MLFYNTIIFSLISSNLKLFSKNFPPIFSLFFQSCYPFLHFFFIFFGNFSSEFLIISYQYFWQFFIRIFGTFFIRIFGNFRYQFYHIYLLISIRIVHNLSSDFLVYIFFRIFPTLPSMIFFKIECLSVLHFILQFCNLF